MEPPGHSDQLPRSTHEQAHRKNSLRGRAHARQHAKRKEAQHSAFRFVPAWARQTNQKCRKVALMRQYRIVQGCLHSVVLLTIACIGIACIIGRVLRFPLPSSAHPSGAAPPAPYTPLHLKRGRDLVPLLWPRGRPASSGFHHLSLFLPPPTSPPLNSRTGSLEK